MGKVIKRNATNVFEQHKIEQFSTVELGETLYQMQYFGNEELSVQDEAAKGRLIGKHLSPVAADNSESHKTGRTGDGNMPAGKSASDDTASEFSERVFTEMQPEDFVAESVSGDEVKVPPSQDEIIKANARIKLLEDELGASNEELAKARAELEQLKGQLQSVQSGIPQKVEDAKKHGYNDGYSAGCRDKEAEGQRKYEAEKQDYLQALEKNWKSAIDELTQMNSTLESFDDQIPDIIVGFVRELIGAERKLNDRIIVNIVKAAMARLKDIQKITFDVNPDDVDIIKESLPGYSVAGDAGIPKGNVKMHTKTGEIDLNVNTWMDGLEKQIYEQLAASEKNQTE